MKCLPQRWRFIRITGLLTLLLLVSLAVIFLNAGELPGQAEKKAEVFALVHVAPKQPGIDEKKAKIDWKEYSHFLQIQSVYLKTRVVLRAALDSPKVKQLKIVKQQKEPVTWLEGQVQVQVDKQTGILRVTVPVGTPDEQVVLTNAVVEAYLAEVVDRDRKLRMNRLDMLKRLHADYDLKLREKRKTLRVLSGELGARDSKQLAIKQETALKEFTIVQAELLQLEMQMRKAKMEVALAKKKEKLPDTPVSTKEVDEALAKNQAVTLLLTEMGQLETTLTTLKRLLTNPEKDAGYLKTLERLESAKKDLTKVRETLRPVVAKQLQDRFRIDQEMQRHAAEQRDSKLAVMDEYLKILKKEVNDRADKVLGFQRNVEDLEWLKDEIAHWEETTRQIGRQVQVLQVALQAPPRIRLLQDAELPGK